MPHHRGPFSRNVHEEQKRARGAVFEQRIEGLGPLGIGLRALCWSLALRRTSPRHQTSPSIPSPSVPLPFPTAPAISTVPLFSTAHGSSFAWELCPEWVNTPKQSPPLRSSTGQRSLKRSRVRKPLREVLACCEGGVARREGNTGFASDPQQGRRGRFPRARKTRAIPPRSGLEAFCLPLRREPGAEHLGDERRGQLLVALALHG